MRITRETDYGIRCVQYLAAKAPQGAVVAEISEAQGIPKTFTAKIMQKLKKAGIVNSMRGIKGGYVLAKHPSEISLYDVVETLNGPLGFNICVVDRKACEKVPQCAIHPIWVELTEEFIRMLKTYNFEQFNKLSPPEKS